MPTITYTYTPPWSDRDGKKGDRALSLGEFRKRLPEIPKEQEIIFYCA